jgi:hypothetical protein
MSAGTAAAQTGTPELWNAFLAAEICSSLSVVAVVHAAFKQTHKNKGLDQG